MKLGNVFERQVLAEMRRKAWLASRVCRRRNSIECGLRAPDEARVENAKLRGLSKRLSMWHEEPCVRVGKILM